MAKKKSLSKGATLKKFSGKGEKIVKKTWYDKLNEKVDLTKYAVPIWSIGVGLFLFLLMFFINGWQYGLVISIPSAVLIGIAVHVINK